MEQKHEDKPVTPAEKENKNNNGLKIACAVLAVATVCGIGFGIFGMIQSSNQSKEISDLKSQIQNDKTTLSSQGTTTESIEVIEQTTPAEPPAETHAEAPANPAPANPSESSPKQNPVISAASPKSYRITFDSPTFSVNGTNYYVQLAVTDGNIVGCDLFTHTIAQSGNDAIETNKFEKNCSGINGLSGKIYKIVLAGEGQDSSRSNVGFIMENGTVNYIPTEDLIKELVNNGTATIKGTLKIDGFVTDAFTVNASDDGVTSYATTIFVLSNGTYVNYSNNMLN